MKFILIILFGLFNSLFANQEIYKLSNIKIIGAQKTERSVVLTELNLEKNKSLLLNQIKQGVQNLKNTNLFSKVNYKIIKNINKNTLEISLEEKWTTIPIFKLSSGGGVSQVTMGLYDPNIFGKYLEAGGQYERLGNTQSGVVWFKNPHLFSNKNILDVQIWSTNRLRTKYIQNKEDPEILTGFLQLRKKLYLSLTHKLSPYINFKVFYDYHRDTFSDRYTSDEIKKILSTKGLPNNTEFHFLGLQSNLGKINFDNFLVDGSKLSTTYRYAISKTKNASDFSQIDIEGLYYKTLFKNTTFAQRLSVGFTSTNAPQYWYYLGGLDKIRGFSDNRFAGRYSSLSNTELRYPVINNKLFVLQANTFIDVVNVSEEFEGISTVDGASIGVGFRVILPKVYRFVVRFDFAKTIKKSDDMNFSFGIQQFF